MGEIAINPIHNVHKKYRKMNLVNHYVFTPPLTYNTFIGGVASTIGSASALATKLAIDVSRITDFSIVGSDIKCAITGSYVIPVSSFFELPSFAYFTDSSNLISQLNQSCFNSNSTTNSSLRLLEVKGVTNILGVSVLANNRNLKEVNLPNLLSVSDSAFADNIFLGINRRYYLPKVTTLGSTTALNSVFNNITDGCVIYANPFLATNNAGGEDGDIAYARSQGATIRFISSFAKPNPVTSLSTGTIYRKKIQLNFTPPTGSANAIDFYKCYADGVFKNTIKASGGYIMDLNPSTSYVLTIVAVDVFMNESVVGNAVTQATNTTKSIDENLVSYYKLNTNGYDFKGFNHGVSTAVTYGAGKIGNCAIYNGTNSKTNIGNPVSLQLSSGTISCFIKSTSAGSSFRAILGKSEAYMLFLNNGILGAYSWGGSSGMKTTGINLNDGLWHHVAHTFESGVANGSKIYLDGNLVLTTTITIGNQTGLFMIGENQGYHWINASIDGASVFNSILSATEISEVYNMQLSGIDLVE